MGIELRWLAHLAPDMSEERGDPETRTDDPETKTDDLREIFMTVSEDGTVTERQEEGPSYEAVDKGAAEEVDDAVAATEDGLDDAIAGADVPEPTTEA